MVPRVQSRGTLSHNVLAEQAYRLPGIRGDGRNRAADPGQQTAPSEQLYGLVGRIRWQDGDHSDAHIEGRFQVRLRNFTELLEESEDRRGLPRRTVNPHLT